MGQLGLTNPAVPGEITQAGMLVCVSDTYDAYYPLTTKPNTSALAAGFRQAGVLSELPTIAVGRDTSPVVTGIYGIAQEILFKGYTGNISFKMYGTDAGLLALGLGITPVSTVTGTVNTTAVGTDGPTGFTSLTFATSQAAFTVGSLVQVCAPANTAFSTCFAKVRANSGNTVVLDRILREVPITISAVSLVTSVEIPLSGTSPKYFSLAGIVDYPDGRVLLAAFPKVYSSKALSFGLGAGQDAVAVPIELDALGSMAGASNVQIGTIKIWP